MDDEIGDATMPVKAIEIVGDEAGKTPVMRCTFCSWRAEIGRRHFARVAGNACPGGRAIDDGGHDESGIAIGFDGSRHRRRLYVTHVKAIPIIIYLTGTTGALRRRLPEFPDEVHGDTGTLITDDLIGIAEIRLNPLNAFTRRIRQIR